MRHPPLPSPAVPTPIPHYQSEALFSSAFPVHTTQHLLYEHQTQQQPTSLVRSSTTVIHTSTAVLLCLLTMHFSLVLAGRLPPTCCRPLTRRRPATPPLRRP